MSDNLLVVVIILLGTLNVSQFILVRRVRASDWEKINNEMRDNLTFAIDQIRVVGKSIVEETRGLILDHEERMHGRPASRPPGEEG